MRKSVSMGLVAGVLGMGLANADIKVDDKLTLSGFIDMSAYYNTQVFVFPGFAGTADEPGATFDQFELDFMYTFTDKLSARVDLNSLGGGAMGLEQGFLTYTTGPLSVYAGKFLSASGWEAAEPTGMFQYDYSNAFVYGGYQNGVAVSYALSPMISLYGALVDGVWTPDGSLERAGVEAQVALMPTEQITAKITGMYEQQIGYGKTVLNAWASYTAGAITAAVEADYLMNYTAEDDNGIGYLAMLNYKLTDVYAVTGRFSGMKTDAMAEAQNEVTIAPSATLLENWFLVGQVKHQLASGETGFAIESLITF